MGSIKTYKLLHSNYYYYKVTSVVSDSVRPQRQQPTRVRHPWDSPGKNTGVTQSCLTLSDPMDCSLPGSSVHGILQVRILEWVTMPSSRGISPNQGSNPGRRHCR